MMNTVITLVAFICTGTIFDSSCPVPKIITIAPSNLHNNLTAFTSAVGTAIHHTIAEAIGNNGVIPNDVVIVLHIDDTITFIPFETNRVLSKYTNGNIAKSTYEIQQKIKEILLEHIVESEKFRNQKLSAPKAVKSKVG